MGIEWVLLEDAVLLNDSVLNEGEPDGWQAGPLALAGALDRPAWYWHFGKARSLSAIAAHYLEAVAKCHAFQQGNKRTALACATYFLDLNGIRFVPEDAAPPEFEVPPPVGDEPMLPAVAVVCGLTEGSVTVEDVAEWIEANC